MIGFDDLIFGIIGVAVIGIAVIFFDILWAEIKDKKK